jgi:lipopolysaccharide export system permease protein
MKKLDRLICQSFAAQFILSFFVIVFILLMVNMLRYFDDVIGKDLGMSVVGELLLYFAIFTTPSAMPLAVLVSSLMTFGNLTETFELSAIKAAGISPMRIMLPLFIVVAAISTFAFSLNNNFVPRAALRAYALMFDIRQKKPALDIRAGTFYHGLTDFSIKVDEKFDSDPDALRGVVVYDHRARDGNRDVTIADSGRMSLTGGQRYLKFELFNGYSYTEGAPPAGLASTGAAPETKQLSRIAFSRSQIVYDLSSMDWVRSSVSVFSGLGVTKNMAQLSHGADSLRQQLNATQEELSPAITGRGHSRLDVKRDSLFSAAASSVELAKATNRARTEKLRWNQRAAEYAGINQQIRSLELQWQRILSSSVACLVMFLIGAPLGTIVKRGGVGIPFLVSIVCFVVYFVLTMLGDKLSRQDAIPVVLAAWFPDALVALVGMGFLLQSINDFTFVDLSLRKTRIGRNCFTVSTLHKGSAPGL